MTFSLRLFSFITGVVALLILATHYTYGQGVVIEPIAEVDYQPDWHIYANIPTPLVAPAYAVFDVESGEVLLAHGNDSARPIASITKLLTAAVVWQDFATSTHFTEVRASDVTLPGVIGAVQVGERYTPHELLFPLLLTSSNHVAATLERVNPELITEMNQFTQQLGLSMSVVADASGLSSNNRASVDDLTYLTHYLYNTNPHIFDITRLERYLGSTRGWTNNNPFVSDVSYRGGKHGYTAEAGRTAIALFAESFTGGERVLGYIVLGTDNSAVAVAKLRAHVSQTLDWQ